MAVTVLYLRFATVVTVLYGCDCLISHRFATDVTVCHYGAYNGQEQSRDDRVPPAIERVLC